MFFFSLSELCLLIWKTLFFPDGKTKPNQKRTLRKLGSGELGGLGLFCLTSPGSAGQGERRQTERGFILENWTSFLFFFSKRNRNITGSMKQFHLC